MKRLILSIAFSVVLLMNSAIQVSAQPAGLVGFWPLDELSGDAVSDASGNNLDGTSYGAIIMDGIVGKCRSFDGSGDYIEIPDDNLLDITDRITIMFWAKTNQPFSYPNAVPICKRVQDGSINYAVIFGDAREPGGVLASGLCFSYGYGPAVVYGTYFEFHDDQWHHFAITLEYGNPSSVKWIIDGVHRYGWWQYDTGAAGGGTELPSPNNYPLRVGGQMSSSPGYWIGQLDQIRIFDQNLSQEEILAIYSQEASIHPPHEVWIISPVDGYVSEETGALSFQWESTGGPYEYYVEFSTESNLSLKPSDPAGVFESPIAGKTTTDNNWQASIGYFLPGTYYWHILAYSNNELVCSTPIFSFSVPGTGAVNITLNQPSFIGDYVVFTGQVIDALSRPLPQSYICCLDASGRRCLEKYTNLDGGFTFECGPLSSGPKGELAFNLISGNARTSYVLLHQLSIEPSLPSHDELLQVLSSQMELSGKVTDIYYKFDELLGIPPPSSAISMPAFGSNYTTTVYQYDETGAYVGATEINMNLAVNLYQGSRTLTDVEYQCIDAGYNRISNRIPCYLVAPTNEAQLPPDTFEWLVLTGGCLVLAAPSGGASCIPLALKAGKTVAWQMINEQAEKGNISQEYIYWLHQLEGAESKLKIALLPFAIANNLNHGPPGFTAQDDIGRYVNSRFSWGHKVYAPEGEVLYKPGYYDLSTIQKVAVQLGWVNTLISGKATIEEVNISDPLSCINGLAMQINGTLSDGTPFDEYVMIGDLTKLKINGYCPFTISVENKDGLVTGWNPETEVIEQHIPFSFATGPTAEPQELVIMQPNENYMLTLRGIETGASLLDFKAFWNDSLVWNEELELSIEKGQEIIRYINVDYHQGKMVVHSNPDGFSAIFGFVSADLDLSSCVITLDIRDTNGILVQSVTTDQTGYYCINNVPNGEYTISIVSPLGYQADQETKELTIQNKLVREDFNLTKLDIIPQARSRAYWAYQLSRALRERKADYTKEDFAGFCNLLKIHFNENPINPVPNYVVPQPASGDDSLAVLNDLLTFRSIDRHEPFVKRLARAQLLALMLNVVSGKISQAEIVSRDGRTLSQAITFCDLLINDIDCEIGEVPSDYLSEYEHRGPCRPYIKASFIAGLINVGVTLPAGAIPEGIIDIRYSKNESGIPRSYELYQNIPNPFNPVTVIRFSLPEPTPTRLEIYNIRGERVLVLINQFMDSGEHYINWDGQNSEGRSVSSGIYFYRLVAGDFVQTRKMVMIR